MDEKSYSSLKKSWNRDVVITGVVGAAAGVVTLIVFISSTSIIARGLSLLSLFFWGMSVYFLLAQRKPLREIKRLEREIKRFEEKLEDA